MIESNGSESRATLRRNQEASLQRESSLNRFQKIENPPSSIPPPPPSVNNAGPDSMRLHGSATTNFSKSVRKKFSQNGIKILKLLISKKVQKGRHENKPSLHAIYSSNDSGFSNELPPAAPEVDYSDDDDLPKKIPIRLVSFSHVVSC